MNAAYCKRQFDLAMLRAQWWIASATSGNYRNRKLFHGSCTERGSEYTDEEKLRAAMETANRHIKIAEEHSEALMMSAEGRDD